MRTNTATFRSNTFKTLRRQGVSSVKAKALTAQIVTDMRLRGNPTLPADSFLAIDIRSVEEQRVVIVSQHLVIWLLETWQTTSMQPLVDCTPTVRQTEIQGILQDMVSDLYDALGLASLAWDQANGHPASEAAYDARSTAVQADAGVIAVKAAYDALVAESLKINPRVSAFVSDPEKASFWYEWVKETRGYRPDGFMTHAMVEQDLARLKTEKPMEDFDFDEAA